MRLFWGRDLLATLYHLFTSWNYIIMSSTESKFTVTLLEDGLKKLLGIYLAPLSLEECKLVDQYNTTEVRGSRRTIYWE